MTSPMLSQAEKEAAMRRNGVPEVVELIFRGLSAEQLRQTLADLAFYAVLREEEEQAFAAGILPARRREEERVLLGTPVEVEQRTRELLRGEP